MKSLLNKRALTTLFATTFLGLALVSCGQKPEETAAETPAAAEAPVTEGAPAAEAGATIERERHNDVGGCRCQVGAVMSGRACPRREGQTSEAVNTDGRVLDVRISYV